MTYLRQIKCVVGVFKTVLFYEMLAVSLLVVALTSPIYTTNKDDK